MEGRRSLALGNQLDRGCEGEEDRRTASSAWALATTGTDGIGWGEGGLTDKFPLVCPQRSRARAWKNRSRETQSLDEKSRQPRKFWSQCFSPSFFFGWSFIQQPFSEHPWPHTYSSPETEQNMGHPLDEFMACDYRCIYSEKETSAVIFMSLFSTPALANNFLKKSLSSTDYCPRWSKYYNFSFINKKITPLNISFSPSLRTSKEKSQDLNLLFFLIIKF